MTDVHPRFKHQCFVSFNKFDTSISRVMDRTFDSVNFDCTKSLLPTFIGVEVEYTPDEELLKATRRFLERLRSVHQHHFVRFVTDTFWAMESSNGDIFYCHDEDKSERVDVIWSIKAITVNQFEINIINTPDNRRRELLTDLQDHLNKVFTVSDDKYIGDHLQDIVTGFYSNTKNIRQIEFLAEDCHVILVPALCGKRYHPVVLCGMSVSDAKRRWRGIKGQIEYQKHVYYQYFIHDQAVGDYLQIPLDLLSENGCPWEDGFSVKDQYNNAEMAFSILDGSSANRKTPHDIIIFHACYEPTLNIVSERYSLKDIAEVI